MIIGYYSCLYSVVVIVILVYTIIIVLIYSKKFAMTVCIYFRTQAL